VKRPFAELSGTGSYLPARVMTNDEFSKILETSDQWIRERTGIRERRVSSKEETNACMGKAAALQVLEQNGLTPLDVDAIVYATASPDRLLPSAACDLQAVLGAKNAAAFDVGAACAGFVYALNVAEGLIASGQGKNVLVIAAEKLTSIMDWTDRTTAVLFGDGAGATLLRPATGTKGVLSSYMKSDGTLAELLYRPGGGAAHPPSDELLKDHSYYIKMAGREGRRVRPRAATRRPLCRRSRSPHSPPGEHSHHRGHGEARRGPDGQGLRQRGPLRQHLGGVDRHRAR
jgi:3-oxoacyl-[acyl-carrier-protein] synthase III